MDIIIGSMDLTPRWDLAGKFSGFSGSTAHPTRVSMVLSNWVITPI